MADGELQDSTRPDLYEYIVDFLTFCPNLDLVWRYSDWALKRDPKVWTYRINITTTSIVISFDIVVQKHSLIFLNYLSESF